MASGGSRKKGRFFALHPAFFAACRKPLEAWDALGYSAHIETRFTPLTERRNIMNVLKHMEAAFLFSLSVAGAASLAIDAIPPAQASVPVRAEAAVQPNIPVVHVSAKRMTETEKRLSLQAERAGSKA
jgi:hypothetical protein